MLAIIIVNYNDWDNLKKCIESISVNFSFKIYVVDNASRKNAYIEDLLKNVNVEYIESKINGGYSFGNNIGLSKAVKDGCKYFIISNTDIIFKRNSIENLISILQKKESDIIGPKIFLQSGAVQEEILGVRVDPIDKIKLILNSASNNFLFKKYRSSFNNNFKNGLDSYEVYGLSGCCFAFNETIATEIMPFDDKIFLFNEEWYIAEKCYRKGYKTMITCNAEVLHLHSSTTKNLKLFSYLHFVKSEFYVLNKFFPYFFICNLFIFFLRLPKLSVIFFQERIHKV